MDLIDDIVLSPDPRLSTRCEEIEEIDDDIRELAEHMLQDMYASDGVGLAAPQIGRLVRLVVIDVDYPTGEENPYVLINPRIVEASEETRVYDEGCLSFPGISVEIERPARVVVHAEDLNGDTLQYEAENNLMAVCLQHEIDHLDGITMLDHLPPLKRAAKRREYDQALAAGAVPGETEV